MTGIIFAYRASGPVRNAPLIPRFFRQGVLVGRGCAGSGFEHCYPEDTVANFHRVFLALACIGSAVAQPSGVLGVLSEELDRNFKGLKEKADPAPYFMSYAVTEQDYAVISASFGAVTSSNQSRTANLDVTVRVGSPKLDNYHRVRGERAHFTSGSSVVIEDTPLALKRRLWMDTDRTYRLAAERLIRIRTNSQVKVKDEDPSDDFSQEEQKSVFSEAPPKLKFSAAEWTPRLRKLSATFARYPGILTSSVSVMSQSETKYMASTEGERLQHGRGFARIIISAVARAEDGMDLTTSETFEAFDVQGLPNDAVVLAGVDRVANDLVGLLKAPVVEPFVGPAILSGRAAGVFFHEIFGHRVEGHRQKDESEGQTFTKSVNGRCCPISSPWSSTPRGRKSPASTSTAGTASTTKASRRVPSRWSTRASSRRS